MPTLKALMLLRVSTDAQAKAKTIEAQRQPVSQLALALGVLPDDVVEYREEAVSGAAPLDERDVLLQLLRDANPVDIVCAFDLSRLTRTDDWLERYTVFGRIRNSGLRAATVEDGEIDFDTIGGRLTFHLRVEIAADERKKIRLRTQSGKRHAALEGRKPQGKTPYGWDYDKVSRRWSLHEPEAQVRKELLLLLHKGESTPAIADEFTRRGN